MNESAVIRAVIGNDVTVDYKFVVTVEVVNTNHCTLLTLFENIKYTKHFLTGCNMQIDETSGGISVQTRGQTLQLPLARITNDEKLKCRIEFKWSVASNMRVHIIIGQFNLPLTTSNCTYAENYLRVQLLFTKHTFHPQSGARHNNINSTCKSMWLYQPKSNTIHIIHQFTGRRSPVQSTGANCCGKSHIFSQLWRLDILNILGK